MSAFEHFGRRGEGSGVTRPAKSRGGKPDEEAAEQLLAGLSHNLRNLTQVVAGNLELVAARTDDELTLRYIANARLAAQLITELAQGLDEPPSE